MVGEIRDPRLRDEPRAPEPAPLATDARAVPPEGAGGRLAGRLPGRFFFFFAISGLLDS